MLGRTSIFTSLLLLLAATVLPAGELEDEAVSPTLKLERRLWEPGEELDETLWRIQEIGPEARVAVPTLLKLLEQQGPRASAARALEGIGGEAVPQLVDASDKTCAPGVIEKSKRVGMLGREQMSPAELASVLQIGGDACRDNLIESLFYWTIEMKWIPAQATQQRDLALQVLLEMKPDPIPQVINRAIGCLQAKQEDDAFGPYIALGVFQALGKRASPAVPKLIEALKLESPAIRATAAQALVAAGQSSASAADALAASLDDARAIVRARAARSLGKLGSIAKPHLAELRKATKDDYLIVRTAATSAIQVIDSQVNGVE